MKKIIKDAKANLYWFDGKRMKNLGPVDDMVHMWRKKIFRIGKDIYACENGEYSLLYEKSVFFLFPASKNTTSRKKKIPMQFKLLSGVLTFQEQPETERIYLSQKLTDSWGERLTAETPDKQRVFTAMPNDEGDERMTDVYTFDKDGKIRKLSEQTVCIPSDCIVFWNGFCYEGIERDTGICPWELRYKTDYYMVLSAYGFTFALFADGTYRYLGFCCETDPQDDFIKTSGSIILVTDVDRVKKLWTLGDISIEAIEK